MTDRQEPLCSWIGSGWHRDGSGVVDQFDPARPGSIVSRTAVADLGGLEHAVATAREALPAWGRLAAAQRGGILLRAAELLEDRAARIGEDLAREEGKSRAEAVGQTRRAAEIFRFFAAQATYAADGATYPPPAANERLYAHRVPVGVVAAITPWNFPIAIPAWKLAPALAYGNAVVWKPAELVPRTSVHLMQALLDAGLPATAVQMVLGEGRLLGARLAEHPGVDALTFTGSTAVGRALAPVAAAAGQPVQLELGGKNAAVVLADADLAHAAEEVARGAFLSAGQKCTATSRIIVERPVLGRFTELLIEASYRLVVGDPLRDGVDVGPLASDARATAVREAIARGVAEGRRLTRRDPADVPPGAFVAPTLLGDLPAASPLLREEIFGPVAAVVAADDADHALALANDSEYGLTAGVFTRDLGQAMRFAAELEVGMVKVNQQTPGNAVHVPFVGTKASGYGPAEQGEAAREFFTSWKTVYLAGV